MRRWMLLGLLLLVGCERSDKEPEPPLPSRTGKVQGTLSPFQGASMMGSGGARPLPLRAPGSAEALSRTVASALRRQGPALPILSSTSSELRSQVRPSAEELIISGEVIVRFEERNVPAHLAVERLATPGYEVVHKGQVGEHLHLVAFRPTQKRAMAHEETGLVAQQLSQRGGIRFAEPNARMYPSALPNDKGYSLQWHYAALNLPAAWDVTTGNNSVVVAVVDTGIVPHPDLDARVLPGIDLISDAAIAGDGDGRDNDPLDMGKDLPNGGSSWHGTHVAGTIGAVSNNTSGVAGVTWNTRILPVRVLGRGGGSSFDILAAMEWASGGAVSGVRANTTPAKIINLSLGGPSAPNQSFQQVIDDAVARGSIFVIAAGNDNTNASNTRPCNQQNVICVGSVGLSGRRSSFSNYGAAVDVMATGGEMREDLNGDGYADGVLSTTRDDKNQPAYIFEQGTSMAAPHVAGVVALMVAVNPQITHAQAEAILKETANPSSQCAEGCGAGLVNAHAAVLRAQGGTQELPPKLGVSTTQLYFSGNETQYLLINNLGSGELRVSAQLSGTNASAVTLPEGSTLSVPAHGSQRLTVRVNTQGMPSGNYSASLSLTGTSSEGVAAGSASVVLKFRVGSAQDKDAIIAFVYEDASGEWQLDEEGVAIVRSSTGYAYELSLTPRSYYVLATIDDDEDEEFFEESDRVGFWRNADSIEPVVVEVGKTVSAISFDLVTSAPVEEPSEVIGRTCSDNSQCSGGFCAVNYPGGYCSQSCDDQPCPVGSRCVLFESEDSFCLATCSGVGGQGSCRGGYTCTSDGAGGGFCLP